MALNAASEKKLAKVNPDLVKVVVTAAEITSQPFQIVQGNRTQAEQDALYAKGRTKPGPIVTWTRKSKHIGGNAVDFAALVNGKISWNEKYYPAIADAFKRAAHQLGIGIEWGGDWKTKDWGHIQLTGKAPALPDAPPSAVHATLRKGAKGSQVERMQVLLNQHGAGLKVDGDFGPLTLAAVTAFQRAKGLVQDGVVGSKTWAALLAAPGSPTLETPQDNPTRGMSRLMTVHDWPDFKAAAFIGRAQQESYHDIRTGVSGDQGTAIGGWQWRLDRRANLERFAKKRGVPITDWDMQIDFMVEELAKSEKKAGVMLKDATTLEQACEAAMAYCRPAGFTWANPRAGHGWANTLANAKRLLAPRILSLIRIGKETDMPDTLKSKEVVLPTVGKVEVEAAPGWTNWKTLAVNAGIVAGTAALQFGAGVNWVEYVGEFWAVLILAGINAALRMATKGPAMSDVIVKKL